MGKRGPKPKVTKLKLLEGNPGKRPLNTNEPEPTGKPRCPEWLGDEAKEVFHRVIEVMPPGIYTGADEHLMTAFSLAMESMQKAAKDIYERGQIIKGRRNPSCMIRDKQAELITKIGDKLGLSPTARQHLEMPRPIQPQAEAESDLLG